MQTERQPTDQEQEGSAGKVAWSLLAVFLIVFPLIAIGRIMVATDDELADIRAQAVAEMEIDHRNLAVTYVSSFGWNESMTNRAYSLNYDVAVLKINARVAMQDVEGDRIAALNYTGFWGVSDGWDFYVDAHTFGDTTGVGDDGIMIMNGIRVELAYDDIDSVDRRFLFFRFGTDDQTGRFNVQNHMRYISFDGILDNNLEETLSWPDNDTEPYMRMNYHRQTLAASLPFETGLGKQALSAVNYMDFGVEYDSNGNPASSGPTDFYISIADTITAKRGTAVITNDGRALGPWNMARNSIPGRGLWMHFQRGFVSAEVDTGNW
ncbi:hypothetical protein SAMN02745216_02306 [Desulfatibacillum alkenivorans DSM 16219]|uniref:Uncharacterized protein n=1 Tax=Desulfatibacillum alkenivorans DSM 16219 TaxID=1121393 RepID=A0A1M6MBA9_9BACT|nr:hypothetical protein [Desulfatibacillum alkenivorans]SHJ80782.1 hypothetical protein SAMN02745216_02306 [Desulfatibacillum alkenivorans DSM 16219]